MINFPFKRAAGALLLCAACAPLAWAQGRNAGAVPSVAEANTPVAPLIYQSALHQFKPFQDAGPADWPAANRRVQEAGGWRAYARESARSAVSPPPGAASAPKPAGHSH